MGVAVRVLSTTAAVVQLNGRSPPELRSLTSVYTATRRNTNSVDLSELTPSL